MARSHDDEVLRHLSDIATYMQDVNAIRNGEYEPPRGADRSRREPMATPDDIYLRLEGITGHLERMNETLYNIGLVLCENKEYWHDLNDRR